ncbi:hypothetical protein TSAR_003705 [Trichomalopsis sarcophagae]|uniref:Uncharacterized protein n=1 Tax=Trichomalopsis sarcophagae TaxID=543379 RepID=A0A232EF43_9HYME|nr:hypothetical protein TSAR_003705 [Trichomalopsis sarcophagae]
MDAAQASIVARAQTAIFWSHATLRSNIIGNNNASAPIPRPPSAPTTDAIITDIHRCFTLTPAIFSSLSNAPARAEATRAAACLAHDDADDHRRAHRSGFCSHRQQPIAVVQHVTKRICCVQQAVPASGGASSRRRRSIADRRPDSNSSPGRVTFIRILGTDVLAHPIPEDVQRRTPFNADNPGLRVVGHSINSIKAIPEGDLLTPQALRNDTWTLRIHLRTRTQQPRRTSFF